MKKTFMWYYSIILLSIGTLGVFYDFLIYANSEDFWAVVLYVPVVVWLLKNA